MAYSLEHTLDFARGRVEAFTDAIGPVHATGRGVLPSEVFFIYATVGNLRPRQVLESGRALGQSTELLARCFPDTPILSVELDEQHPDSAAAIERLKGIANVACLFGDSRTILPERASPGDVVVIDGPKGFRALKLAFAVMSRKQPAMVFVHDCPRGSPMRRFIHRHMPWAFFSDDPRWVRGYCRLDTFRNPGVLARWSDPAYDPQDLSYGGPFACVPFKPGFPGLSHRLQLLAARFLDNLSQHRRHRARPRAAPPETPTP